MSAKFKCLLKVVALPLRIYIGAIFIYASVYKIADPHSFALSVATYQILPLWAINLFAIFMPWLEFVTGVLLIAGVCVRECALIISAMLVMFIIAILIAMSKELQMSCGCFASEEAENDITWATVLRDTIWLLISGFVMLVDDGEFGLTGLWRRLRPSTG